MPLYWAGLSHAQYKEAAPAPVQTQAPTQQPAPKHRELRAPELLQFAEAIYPPAALAAGQEATVVLKLKIDELGAVEHAEVTQPVAGEFGPAAVLAALKFVFQPASADGQSIAATALYAYEFRLPIDWAPEASAPPAAATAASPPPAQADIDVTVQGFSRVEEMQRSAESVRVVDMSQARRESSSLGKVLNRVAGVHISSGSSLGANSRVLLSGQDGVKVYVDGIPIENTAYGAGSLDTLPVNVVERVEVYDGVVPSRFGTDTMAGVINIITDPGALVGSKANVSYQIGSFGLQMAQGSVRHGDARTGIQVSGSAFYQGAKNNYPIDQAVPNDRGQLETARVHRFHEAFERFGGEVQGGVRNARWADQFSVRVYSSSTEREFQGSGSRPFGERKASITKLGSTLRYSKQLDSGVSLRLTANYDRLGQKLDDKTSCIYDWYGKCDERPFTFSEIGGIGSAPIADRRTTHIGSVMTGVGVQLAKGHRIEVNSAPRIEKLENSSLGDVISGAEYWADLLGDRLQNVLGFKHYFQRLRSSTTAVDGDPLLLSRDSSFYGLNEGIVLRLGRGSRVKLAYEWATNLPSGRQVFGRASQNELSNLELLPERSHNLNLSLRGKHSFAKVGTFHAGASGSLRAVDNLIIDLPEGSAARYRNVSSAQALVLAVNARWTSPRRLLELSGSYTAQDYRNISSEGPFSLFNQQRIPNRPPQYARGEGSLNLHDIVRYGDRLRLTLRALWDAEHFPGWESVGSNQPTIQGKFQLGGTLGYETSWTSQTLGASAELQNALNNQPNDPFGLQTVGRTVHFKLYASFF